MGTPTRQSTQAEGGGWEKQPDQKQGIKRMPKTRVHSTLCKVLARSQPTLTTQELQFYSWSRELMIYIGTIGGDLQPDCLADRLLTGLGQPRIYPYWLQWEVTFSQVVWLIGCLTCNGYNDYNGGWPSARLFGWSAADWSWPATNISISSERKRKSLAASALAAVLLDRMWQHLGIVQL